MRLHCASNLCKQPFEFCVLITTIALKILIIKKNKKLSSSPKN